MADYATHAQNARELLEASGVPAKPNKSVQENVVAAAQVEALLALAAAIAQQGTNEPDH